MRLGVCRLLGGWRHTPSLSPPAYRYGAIKNGIIMGTLWSRVWATEEPWDVGSLPIASLSPGQTLARVHFGARWFGVTSSEQSMQTLADDFMAVGVVSQTSAHGSTPPNALTGAIDAAPPLERWLWWATTQMRPITIGPEHPDISMWGTDVTSIIDDTKGQVKANVPAGQSLDVYISWAPWSSSIWKTRGNVTGQMWASALILT